ncbi:1,4-alpha-glucan branching enzyme [Pricia antarctica]|uniref:1,4-alpha-glucan branching enzyme n=1 Tax=Pricia antarctica TaxID=641691 RepID=A0A1G7AQK9_9FLAO|nr:alpha-amylase family glycosyl hydrolase [Pricia antarctica]SDE16285.1 1,4-alpha-glucan branching enzyme [Pricia antarctica]
MATATKKKPKHKKIETQPGMGAIPKSGQGTTFRVWAPNAEKVSVVGEFNAWKKEDHIMHAEGDGYWTLDIPKVKEGMEYKFAVHSKNRSELRNDPFTRQMTNSDGNSIVAKRKFSFKESDFKIADLDKLMIYQMHIGTFNREEKKDKVGSFKSAQKILGYLKNLGINAVQLMPVAEFAGGISWGYNPAAPFAIESDYGGPNAFAEFVDKAHGHGIAVIIDVVYNHFGPSDTDLWQFDGWSENDKGGIYFYNGRGRQRIC